MLPLIATIACQDGVVMASPYVVKTRTGGTLVLGLNGITWEGKLCGTQRSDDLIQAKWCHGLQNGHMFHLPWGKIKYKRNYQPIGLCVADVSFDVHFFPSGINPLLVDVVHSKPRFARWGWNYFKSVTFLQPATLQMEFDRPSQTWHGGGHLDRTHYLSGEEVHLIHLISLRGLNTLFPVLVNLDRGKNCFPTPDSLCPCSPQSRCCCSGRPKESRWGWWGCLSFV